MTAIPLRSPRWTWAALMLLTALLAGVEAGTSTEVWLGWTPTTLSSWGSTAFLGSVLASCAAAWIAVQPRLHSFTQWRTVSPRPWAADAAHAALLVASAVVSGQLAVLLVMLTTTVRANGPTGEAASLWLEIPTVSVYVTGWACAGALGGRLLPPFVSLGVSIVTPYVAYAVVTSYVSGSPIMHLIVGEGRSWDYVQPTADNMVPRLLVHTFLAAALLGAMYSWTHCRRWLFAAGVAMSVGLFGGPRTAAIPHSQDLVCDGARPTVCVDTAHAAVLPQYRASVEQLWPLVPGPLRQRVIAQDEQVAAHLRDTGRTSVLVASPAAGDTEPSRVVDHARFAQALGLSVLNLNCTPTDPDDGPVTGAPMRLVLLAWWRLTADLPVEGTGTYWDPSLTGFEDSGEIIAAARRLVDMDASSRAQWFADVRDDIGNCTHDDITLL